MSQYKVKNLEWRNTEKPGHVDRPLRDPMTVSRDLHTWTEIRRAISRGDAIQCEVL